MLHHEDTGAAVSHDYVFRERPHRLARQNLAASGDHANPSSPDLAVPLFADALDIMASTKLAASEYAMPSMSWKISRNWCTRQNSNL